MRKVARLNETSLAERARAEIQRAILEGAIEPEERIPIERIAEELGVSRTPVREALKALEGDGLVDLHPNRGAVVRSVAPEELDHRYAIRAMVEGYAVELACRADAAGLARELEANCLKARQITEGSRAGTERNIRALVGLNLEFHETIAAGSGSPTARGVLERVQNPISFSLFFWGDPERRQVSIEHHEAITGAIAAGAAKRARKLMEEHILDATKLIVAGAGGNGRHSS